MNYIYASLFGVVVAALIMASWPLLLVAFLGLTATEVKRHKDENESFI